MKLHLQDQSLALFSHYENDALILGGQRITETALITPSGITHPWGPNKFSDLALIHFQELAALDVELILFGTGNKLRFPSASLYYPVMEQQKGIEFMDNRALCRTYNILVAEDRSVAAITWMGE